MADQHADPSGNTEAFRAFVERPEQQPTAATAPPSRLPLFVGLGAAAVLVIAVVAWLAA